MCYDIKVLYETALKRARRKNDTEIMHAIEKELETFKKAEFVHVSGFIHPKLPVYSSENPFFPKFMHWGLIPGWVKDEKSAIKLQKTTLNARAETVFEKPAFSAAAKNKRCLVFVDGFYEHHHFNGKTYPFFIQSENETPLCLAGIWDEWINQESGEIYKGFSILTTKAIGLMKTIHNNSKLPESRMPFLLTESNEELWLSNKLDKTELQNLLNINSDLKLKAHTVRPLRGKFSADLLADADEKFVYPELSPSPGFEF